MGFFSLKTRRTFITSYSREEVINVIHEMLSSKSKILFFTVRDYFGYAKGLEFAFSAYSGYQTRLLVPMIKGQITNDNPTSVELKFQLPIIPTLFLLVFPLTFLPLMFTADEMTINDVLREPTITERLGFSLFSIGVPAILFYTNIIRPLQKLQSVLKNKLRLNGRR